MNLTLEFDYCPPLISPNLSTTNFPFYLFICQIYNVLNCKIVFVDILFVCRLLFPKIYQIPVMMSQWTSDCIFMSTNMINFIINTFRCL